MQCDKVDWTSGTPKKAPKCHGVDRGAFISELRSAINAGDPYQQQDKLYKIIQSSIQKKTTELRDYIRTIETQDYNHIKAIYDRLSSQQKQFIQVFAPTTAKLFKP